MGIGVNGIVGSGVYLLIAPLAQVAGGSSVAGVLGCGALCVLIALCFAELSSLYDRSGGPYVYARDAFGKHVGFAVGWLGMATGVLGLAAVSVGFATALDRFVPAASLARVPVAAFLSIFMMSGFEYTAVPAGEVRDARRTVPLAVVGSISGASLLYALLQLAALGALPDVALREQPLPDVAARALGSWGAPLLGATALLSMLGFCASVALVAPRYFTALAEDGHLPRALAGLSTRGTPALAIAASTAFAAALAIVLGYASLVDVSNVVILSGYALTCLAALVLRVRRPEAPRRYRPALLIPVLAFTAAVALLVSARPRAAEWRFAALLLGAGFA